MNNRTPTVLDFIDFFNNENGIRRSSKDFFEGKYTDRSDKGHFFEYRRISEEVFFCGLCGKETYTLVIGQERVRIVLII